jgi:hypothetical protein
VITRSTFRVISSFLAGTSPAFVHRCRVSVFRPAPGARVTSGTVPPTRPATSATRPHTAPDQSSPSARSSESAPGTR